MSGPGERVCARAQQLVSAWLDGRLDAKRRAALQRHLLHCDACQRVVRQTERLARATHNLPPQRVAPDLGSRVQVAVAARRGRRLEALDGGPVATADARRAVRWRAVAIAASLVATWSLGYGMGVGRGVPSQPPAPPAPTARAEVPVVEGALAGSRVDATLADRSAVDSGVDGAPFVAGCRRVLRELAAIDELPPRARQPWIASQLELFELPRRAEQVLAADPDRAGARALASLIRDLSAAVELGDVDWPGWQQRGRAFAATAPGLTTTPVPTARLADLPADRRRIEGIVDRHAARLDDRERAQLGAVLELEQRLAEGVPLAGRDFVRRFEVQLRSSGSVATSFSFAAASAGARTLSDAGLEQEAAALQQLVAELRRQLDAHR